MPQLHRLLPKQCHVTGFSLFITVFIGLGAAGLMLEGGFGAAKPHVAPCHSIAHGCWAAGCGAAPGWKGTSYRAQSCPEGAPGGVRAVALGTATAYSRCSLGGLGRRAELQGQACQNHQDPQESFIGDSEAAGQNTTFLTSSSRAGAPAHPGSPWDAAPISVPGPVSIYKQPRAGAACSRGTGGTESQGQRCSARRAVTPHGWEGAHAEAWGRQSPSQQLLLRCQAKANGGKATPGAAPNPLCSAWFWGSAGHLPALSAPALGGGTARWLAGRGVAGDIAPTPPGAHATGRACWAFTW